MAGGLRDYGLTDRNISATRWTKKMRGGNFLYWKKRKSGWMFIFPGKSGTYPAAAFRGYIFPSSGLGHSFADSLRNNDHLWKNRTSDCGKKRGRPGLCPGGGRSCRAQSHFYLLSLPPCCRKQWKPDRIFGRFAEKSSAAYAGTCKYGAFLSAEKGNSFVKEQE